MCYVCSVLKKNNAPLGIKYKLQEKRMLRRRWQSSRLSEDKTAYNRSAKPPRTMITNSKNNSFEQNLAWLSAKSKNHYSLWKIKKNSRGLNNIYRTTKWKIKKQNYLPNICQKYLNRMRYVRRGCEINEILRTINSCLFQ